MEIKESYENGYIVEKEDKIFLILTCRYCKDTQNLWIVPRAGKVEVDCLNCGEKMMVDLKWKQ